MSKIIIVVLTMLALAVLSAPVLADVTIVPSITDYGNGVLYFIDPHNIIPPGFGDTQYQDFGTALSEYLSENPNKEVVSVVADAGAGYGETSGFYVIVRDITPTATSGYGLTKEVGEGGMQSFSNCHENETGYNPDDLVAHFECPASP